MRIIITRQLVIQTIQRSATDDVGNVLDNMVKPPHPLLFPWSIQSNWTERQQGGRKKNPDSQGNLLGSDGSSAKPPPATWLGSSGQALPARFYLSAPKDASRKANIVLHFNKGLRASQSNRASPRCSINSS